jgi:hypothetical protein
MPPPRIPEIVPIGVGMRILVSTIKPNGTFGYITVTINVAGTMSCNIGDVYDLAFLTAQQMVRPGGSERVAGQQPAAAVIQSTVIGGFPGASATLIC